MIVVFILVLALLSACASFTDTDDVSPTASPAPTEAAPEPTTEVIETEESMPQRQGAEEHSIGVRLVEGNGEFYDRQTGEVFIPRGVNYNRWTFTHNGRWDALFNTSFGQLEEAGQDLQEIHDSGYNVVRVFMDAHWGSVPGQMGDSNGGLSAEYMDNIVDFLFMARDLDIYVLFTNDQISERGGYYAYQDPYGGESFNGNNVSYLTPGGIEANRIWFEDFVRELQARDAPMDAIFAYQLRNEAYYDLIWPPFSLTEGMITAANGETYDMADPDDRQRMMDEGWLNWIDEMVDGIKALDPTALVTMGFFYPMGPESDRLVYTEPVLHRSSLDFVDLHAYPDVDVTSLDEYVERFKLEAIEEKPILMGEFGVGKEPVPSIADAARMLQWWQVNSCDYGFDGWLLWSWGTGDASAEFWAAVSAEREVNQALAPVFRPDACQPGPEMLEHPNLAYQKPVTASNEETTAYNGQKAVDGSLLSWWSAADGPPQTLEIDLEAPMAVGGFRLPFGDLTPLGFQRHEVWVKGPEAGASYELVHVFEADVTVGDVLEHRFPEPLEGIQFVRLRTVQMNDWVILHEFEILAPE